MFVSQNIINFFQLFENVKIILSIQKTDNGPYMAYDMLFVNPYSKYF